MSVARLGKCPNCAALTRAVEWPTLGKVCPICLRPWAVAPKPKPKPKRHPATVQRNLEKREKADFERYKNELRRAERRDRRREDAPDPDEEFRTELGNFLRSDPGYPLGPHAPPGASLRVDGQTHREAWQSIMRADPCAYCGKRPAGTVDHIVAQSKAARGEAHNWLNYTGACTNCNGNKSDKPLLGFMLLRAAPRLKVASRTPYKDRRLAREREAEAA